ncbi:MAG: long-chain-fatty-acid--CoA ligase [Candidatus Poseidoniales archaeon]|nr:MAG: long-chain-fatty-acid--CoA ligase [Candidatus Poseidoniales archaeon]
MLSEAFGLGDCMITPQYLFQNAEKYGNMPAMSTRKGEAVRGEEWQWNTDTWSEVLEKTLAIAKSLHAMGYEKHDKLSIYSYNRPEWFLLYAASQMLNGVAVGVYHTCSPEEVEWVVGNSESKFVFVGTNPQGGNDPEKMPNTRMDKIMGNLPLIQNAVVLEDSGSMESDRAMTWSDFLAKGEGVETSVIKERMNGVDLQDTCALIYTSGTTGNPKGVELTYDNFSFELDCIEKFIRFSPGDGYVSWLPLAHVFGQVADNHLWIRDAMHLHVVDNALHAVDYAKKVQPALFIGVPRIYEKVYSNLKSTLDSKAIIRIGLKIPGLKKVLQKAVKRKIGMVNCKYAITGAAPINPDILKLFHHIGVPLYEGYGMTETTAGASINYKGNMKIGSVGRTLPGGTELKTDTDGEIMFRGRHVMKGYYNNPEATAEVMDGDWLRSGDIGKIDSDGYVTITGRKKELYVSSGGKNIAPLVIEETMKGIPLISQFFLVGDARKFCSGLVTLDVSAILRDKFGMDGAHLPKDPAQQIALLNEQGHQLSEYTGSADIHAEIEAQVMELNKQFAPPEQVKKFTILPRDFTVDDGELTPTLKIRRIQIRENWSDEIEQMYA